MTLHLRLIRAAVALCLMGLVHPSAPLRAQEAPAPAETPPARFVVRNATVVQAPGRTLSNGQILIEDGWITGVGSSADSVPGLPVVEAEGWFVYPGLLVALAPPAAENPSPLASIRPSALLSTPLPAPPFDAAALRSQGITAVLVSPAGTLTPAVRSLWSTGDARGAGSSSVATGSAREPRGVRPGTSAGSGLRTGLAGSFGPSATTDEVSVMTAFAGWRALFARYREEAALLQGDEPEAGDASSDGSADLLAETAAGARPVFFHAPADLDARRAFALTRELGLRLVLTEPGTTDWLPPLRRFRNRPPEGLAGAVLRLSPAETPSVSDPIGQDDAFPAGRGDAFPAGLLSGQEGSAEKVVSIAQAFLRRHIPFAFSLTGADPALLLANLRHLVADGLPERAALAALTTDAASVFGVRDRFGSIDSGRVADLVVTDGPLFAPGTRIVRVYLAGLPYEITAAEAVEAPGAIAGSGPAGRWQYEIEGPGGRLSGVLTVILAEDRPSGSMTMGGDSGPMRLEEVEVGESEIRFVVRASTSSGPLTLRVQSAVDSDAMTGTAEIGRFGTFPFRATRMTSDQLEAKR